MGFIKTVDGSLLEVERTYEELDKLISDGRVGWIVASVVKKKYHDAKKADLTKHKINIENICWIS